MSHPAVSIVVPVYNAEAFLEESLRSIVAQSFGDREIIFMDDASTDRSASIVERFGDAVTLVRQPRNRGQFGNVWDGIDRARGDFVSIYHADDIYDPTIVEKEVAYLRAHPGVGAVFCMDRFMDPAGHVYGELRLPDIVRGEAPLDFGTVLNALLEYRNRFLRTPGAMVRREVYREVGPFQEERYASAADLDMWMRIARRYPVAIIEEHLFNYRHTATSEAHKALHLRTTPDLAFIVIDDHLGQGLTHLVRPDAAAAYEAYRQEDRLLIAANHYIRDELPAMRRVLREVELGRLVASPRVQRFRLLVLHGLLTVLSRLPRIAAIADRFYARWHSSRWRVRGASTTTQ